VAIIAVLVAIAIPMFTAQLEKAREATDQSNIRAAYAVVSADAITKSGTAPDDTQEIEYDLDGNGYITATVTATQQDTSKWESDSETSSGVDIGGQTVNAAGTWMITYDTTNMKVTIS
jgi:type IV pilus assembly protein PilA